MKYKKGTFAIIPNKDIIKKKKKLPKFKSGIYFLIYKNEIVYVGQTLNEESRIFNHLKQGNKKFDSYSFIKIKDKHKRDLIEALYIYTKKPKYNKILCIKKKIKKELLSLIPNLLDEI
jgi:predicted GIY-YIG superfamily endonuclease